MLPAEGFGVCCPRRSLGPCWGECELSYPDPSTPQPCRLALTLARMVQGEAGRDASLRLFPSTLSSRVSLGVDHCDVLVFSLFVSWRYVTATLHVRSMRVSPPGSQDMVHTVHTNLYRAFTKTHSPITAGSRISKPLALIPNQFEPVGEAANREPGIPHRNSLQLPAQHSPNPSHPITTADPPCPV